MRNCSGTTRFKRNRTSARRGRAANRIRKLTLERFERRDLLAEINLTSVIFIERDNLSTSITPIIGEQVCIRANYSTTSLPAGTNYRIQFSLDSVPISVSNVTSGAGLSSGSWYYYQCGWYASPGQHSVQVILDADNTVAETNESNNTLATPRVFTPVAPTTLPQKFLNPLGGVPFHDWRISNYLDVDPSSGIKDFQGGTFTYDGHSGHDIGIVNFARMDRGIPEYAAADGVVEQMQDGNFDRNDTRGSRPANFITINHGNGWRTLYYHLMTNTITVSVGDAVTAGQFLGLAGSSGDSSGPHLHFAVTHNGNSVESEYSPSDYYVNPFGYQGSQPTYVLDAVVTNASPTDSDFDERPGEQTIFSTQNVQSPVLTFWVSTVLAGERVDIIEYRPDGTVNSTNTTLVVGPINSGSYWWRPSNSALSANPGTWRFAIVKNGVELASRSFVVITGPGVPQIRVTQSTRVIIDNRTTAVDFGSVAAGGAAPRQSFTIDNTGTSPLLLSNLQLPPGFVLSGTLPASIAAGASSTINVDLTTTAPGSKFGSIQFSTNDPDAPTFNFNVSGTVTGTAPAAAPVVSLVGPALAYTKLGQEMPLKPAALLTDADSVTFAGGTFTAEFSSQSSGADQLGIADSGIGAGQIGVSGNTVTFGGITIATFTGGSAGAPLSVTFNAAATRAAVQALLRNVTFRTTSTNPENLSRYVRFSLTDDTGNLSNQPIAVVAQNLYPTTISLDTAGNLLIADSSVAGKDDIWKLKRSGDNLQLTDLSGYFIDASSIPGSTGNVSSVVTIPLSALSPTGQVLLDTRAGNDSLTVDLSTGDPIPAGGLYFLGGDPTFAPGDKLTIIGGDQGTVTYNYTSAHDGNIVMSNFGTINYTGLEPIVNTGAATDILFNLPAGTNAVTLADDGTTGNSISRLSAATFEQTDFANPSGSLTINRGNAADTITISAIPDFSAGLAIGSAIVPLSSISFAGSLSLAASKSLRAYAQTLTTSASITTIGGSVELAAANGISIGGPLATAGGAITLNADSDANGIGTFTLAAVVLSTFAKQSPFQNSDGAGGDRFGQAVAISGDGSTAVIGAYWDDVGANANQGSAYVFTWTGTAWQQQQKLLASDGKALDSFGQSVALSNDGNTAIVGSRTLRDQTGRAYVFTRVGGIWTAQQQLVSGVDEDGFGAAVSLSSDGNTALVGGAAESSVFPPSVQLSAFVFTRVDNVWAKQQQLPLPFTELGGGTLNFGYASLSGDGKTALVRAAMSESPVYVYAQVNGVWSVQQQITIPNTTDSASGRISLSGDGNTAIVAKDITFGSNGASAGLAYVFTRVAGVWSPQQQLLALDAASGDGFGSSVALSDDGNTALVGASLADVGGNVDQGAAYVFTRTAGVWTQKKKLVVAAGQAGDRFGGSVSLSGDGNAAIVGAALVDVSANVDQGAAFSFSGDDTIGLGAGPLTVKAADIDLRGTVATSGPVSIAPSLVGQTIDLGTTTVGALSLSDAELDRIVAGTINLGDTNSGAVTVSADITRDQATNIRLASGGAISISGGAINTAGGDVVLSPGSNANVGAPKSGTDIDLGTAGKVRFASGSSLAIAINGTVADTQYDQLQVAGNIDLTGLTLALSGIYAPRIGESFTIVNNLGESSVAGEFSGLADGKAFQIPTGAAAGYYVIDYHGGDGNDVVITRVNLLPAFDSIADPSPLDEDSPAQLLLLSGVGPGFGHNIFSFTATSSNPALIPNPHIDVASSGAMANLLFQPVANQYGTATITVTLQDDGGANGRIDTITRTFTIAVGPINDPPSFTYLVGNYSALDENSLNHGPASAQSVPGWATNISAGAVNEAAQELSFHVTNDNNKLFTVQPEISNDGKLTYKPAPNARGVANVTVFLQDDGSGDNSTVPLSFQIEIVKPHPLHNSRDSGARNGLDVTGATSVQPDGFITAGDVLAVINYINAKGSGAIPSNTPPGPPYPDVNGDDQVVAEDVLKIINYINANTNQSEAFGQDSGSFGLESSTQLTTAAPEITIPADLINLLATDASLAQAKRRRLVI